MQAVRHLQAVQVGACSVAGYGRYSTHMHLCEVRCAPALANWNGQAADSKGTQSLQQTGPLPAAKSCLAAAAPDTNQPPANQLTDLRHERLAVRVAGHVVAVPPAEGGVGGGVGHAWGAQQKCV